MDIFDTWLVTRPIAHCGLWNKDCPENSLAAFKHAIEKNYPIEFDVCLTSDDEVVVFHDVKLSRMTGADGYIRNTSLKELKKLRLNNTKETIPTFSEVLALVAGKIPMLIEIKNSSIKGARVLEQKVYAMLKNYNGEYAIQSFNPFTIEWFKKNAPEVTRGILTSSFKEAKSYKPAEPFSPFFLHRIQEGRELTAPLVRIVLKRMLFNNRAKPHFISSNALDMPNRFLRRYKKLPHLAFWVSSQPQYLEIIKHADNIIFDCFEPKI